MSQAMASIEEVWGSSFSKRPQPLSSKASVPEKRDAQAEGRVASSPQERSVNSINAHRKTIDDLSNSLPIVKSDDEKNYPPPMSTNHGASLTPMASSMATINPIQEGFTPAYAPPGFQTRHHQMRYPDRGNDTNATHDMMLYIFTGIFFLFTLDSFVNMGRRMRR